MTRCADCSRDLDAESLKDWLERTATRDWGKQELNLLPAIAPSSLEGKRLLDEIADQENQTSLLRQRLSFLDDSIAKKRARLIPARRLSSELLVQIFHFVVEDGPEFKFPKALLHPIMIVCQRWRDIMLSIASLLTGINIDAQSSCYDSELSDDSESESERKSSKRAITSEVRRSRRENALKSWLLASQGAPLDISFRSPWVTVLSLRDQSLLEWKYMVNHASRWRKMALNLVYSDVYLKILEESDVTADRLEELTFHCQKGSHSLAPSFPRLRILTAT